MTTVNTGLRITGLAMAANIILAGIKIAGGVIGRSQALVADGIESTADILSSFIVWSGLRISTRPADRNHPYGHGKAESISGVAVSLILIGAALWIAVQSFQEILTPQQMPAWYTLPVLVLVVLVKEALYRVAYRTGRRLDSVSLQSDAWHHRSDALTSMAAFVGIAIALIGGPGYEAADDWAALAACGLILYNGVRLLGPALDEVMDAAVPEHLEQQIRDLAASVEGVSYVEKCRIRKSGLGLLMDIHVSVDGRLSVQRGHEIAHRVKDRLCGSPLPIRDVVVHVEPHTR